jgi:sec-independent protein translocase protein TatA
VLVDIGPPELIIVLVLVLLLFGGSQLPKLAKNLGKAQSEFKSALEDGRKAMTGEGTVADQDESSAGKD